MIERVKRISTLVLVAVAANAITITATAGEANAERSRYRRGSLSAAPIWREVKRATQRRDAVSFRHDGINDAWGTGVLVGRSRNGREGLVLTVNHNLPERGGPSAHVLIGSKRARVTSVVASNVGMDYALVRVKLARPGMLKRIGGLLGRAIGRKAKPALPKPAKLSRLEEMVPGGRVYMSGHPTPEATNPHGRARFGKELTGRVEAQGTGGETPSVPSLTMSYSSGLGFSGAPVYSSKTNRVVGIHHANMIDGGKERSFAVPAGMILNDLAGKLGRGQIAKQHRRQLTKMLRGSGIDLGVR